MKRKTSYYRIKQGLSLQIPVKAMHNGLAKKKIASRGEEGERAGV